jgi:hypothetical protein
VLLLLLDLLEQGHDILPELLPPPALVLGQLAQSLGVAR